MNFSLAQELAWEISFFVLDPTRPSHNDLGLKSVEFLPSRTPGATCVSVWIELWMLVFARNYKASSGTCMAAIAIVMADYHFRPDEYRSELVSFMPLHDAKPGTGPIDENFPLPKIFSEEYYAFCLRASKAERKNRALNLLADNQ